MILLLLAWALAGCGSTLSASATRDAERRAQAAYADCDAQLRRGQLKSYRQAVDCARPKVLAAYQENGYPYMDLVNLDLSARSIGAERIDTGFASEADVNRDIAELGRRIAAEQQRRLDAERSTGASPPIFPPERLLVGLEALTNKPLPRAGANCFTVGSFTRCE